MLLLASTEKRAEESILVLLLLLLVFLLVLVLFRAEEPALLLLLLFLFLFTTVLGTRGRDRRDGSSGRVGTREWDSRWSGYGLFVCLLLRSNTRRDRRSLCRRCHSGREIVCLGLRGGGRGRRLVLRGIARDSQMRQARQMDSGGSIFDAFAG